MLEVKALNLISRLNKIETIASQGGTIDQGRFTKQGFYNNDQVFLMACDNCGTTS